MPLQGLRKDCKTWATQSSIIGNCSRAASRAHSSKLTTPNFHPPCSSNDGKYVVAYLHELSLPCGSGVQSKFRHSLLFRKAVTTLRIKRLKAREKFADSISSVSFATTKRHQTSARERMFSW